MLEFFIATDQNIQTLLIRNLLIISGEIASDTRLCSDSTRSVASQPSDGCSSLDASILVCTSIQDILVAFVKKDAKKFVPFEDTILEHLNTAPHSSIAVKQACVLLSFLVDEK